MLCCGAWLGSDAVSWDEVQSWEKGAGEKDFTSGGGGGGSENLGQTRLEAWRGFVTHGLWAPALGPAS